MPETELNLNGSYTVDPSLAANVAAGTNGAGVKWFCDEFPLGGSVNIHNPNVAVTKASVNTTGNYRFRFVVSDGAMANKAEKTFPNVQVYYNVSINYNGGSGGYGNGSQVQGTVITISAGSRPGYGFTGWTINSGGVSLASAGSATTTFVMPRNDVSFTANWVILCPCQGHCGGYCSCNTNCPCQSHCGCVTYNSCGSHTGGGGCSPQCSCNTHIKTTTGGGCTSHSNCGATCGCNGHTSPPPCPCDVHSGCSPQCGCVYYNPCECQGHQVCLSVQWACGFLAQCTEMGDGGFCSAMYNTQPNICHTVCASQGCTSQSW